MNISERTKVESHARVLELVTIVSLAVGLVGFSLALLFSY